jgi:hypothetical protein
MEFDGKMALFYKTCLQELKSREDWTEAYLPMLERFVFMTQQAAKVGDEIAEEAVTVKHTNRAEKTNEVSSPKWRMYLLLDKQVNALAKDLRLSPVNSPDKGEKPKEKKGFDTSMKVAK